MVWGWREKALFSLSLVLKGVQELDVWDAFMALLRMHIKKKYRLALTQQLVSASSRRDAEEVARSLLELLGENLSVLSAYYVAEYLQEILQNQPEMVEKFALEWYEEPVGYSDASLSDIEEQSVAEESQPSSEAEEMEPDGEGELPKQACTTDEYEAVEGSEPPTSDGVEIDEAIDIVSDSEVTNSEDTTSDYSSTEGSIEFASEKDNDAERTDYEQESQSDGDNGEQPEVEAEDRDDEPELVEQQPDIDNPSEQPEGDEPVLPNPPPPTPEHDSDCEHDADLDYQGVGEATGKPDIKRHIHRQAMLLTGAIKDMVQPINRTPITVESIQHQLEHFIFNPGKHVPEEYKEVRYNFYPPFVTPKAIANYHVFSVTAPIPKSCKANRSGSKVLKDALNLGYFRYLPQWRVNVEIKDGLGDEVTPVGELPEEVKLIPLVDDISRLQWAKSRAEHATFFSYPSLHMPPKIVKMLMETLIQPIVDEHKPEDGEVEMCVTDEELAAIVDPMNKMSPPERLKAMQTRRTMMTMAVRYCAQLELMQRIFREPSMVKKCQEVLHHTFHHGYVSLIREVAKVNLSNYLTYHGVTYNNPLNNCIVSRLMEGADKADFVIDSIYLFLVLNWQTAMGMWSQAIDDDTIKLYAEMFTKWKRCMYSMTSVNEMASTIINILMDEDRLAKLMRDALPNFCSQSQLANYRHYLMERSNLPLVAASFLPTDFIPLVYKESAPLLWDHVYFLRLACFLANHGGYLDEREPSAGNYKSYCPCNLCSPHRMPHDNVALHNEMLAIDSFEIRSPEGKVFKLTPEIWTNAYLDKFVAEDFHPYSIFHYERNKSRFIAERSACVTSSPEILTMIRQIEETREEFLLTKGKGTYKDPETGETISHTVQGAELQAGFQQGKALPILGTGAAGGVRAPAETLGAVRHQAHNGDGPEDDRREGPSSGGRPGTPRKSARRVEPRGGYRRRVNRKPGHRVPEPGVGAGGGSSGGRGADSGKAPQERPRSILKRGATFKTAAQAAAEERSKREAEVPDFQDAFL